MHVVLMAMGIGPGDEVITPSQTWVSTINIITLLGAEPVMVDIDRDTLMVSAESVKKRLPQEPKQSSLCIMPERLVILMHSERLLMRRAFL